MTTTGITTHHPAQPPSRELIRAAEELRRLGDVLLRVDSLNSAAPAETDAMLATVAAELAALTKRIEPAAQHASAVVEAQAQAPAEARNDAVGGPVNRVAPPLTFHISEDLSVHAQFALGLAYQGPVGSVHGGISALLLDHALGIASEASNRTGLTATITLDYQRRVPLFEPLTIRARYVKSEGRKSYATGEILYKDEVCVRAKGLFITP